jgi:transcriptional regulator with XRE-family HTH domain
MTEHLGTEVADRVRGFATQKRVTQTSLAQALGLSRMAIVRRLNGSVSFSDRELLVLSRTLGVPVGAFFGEVAA